MCTALVCRVQCSMPARLGHWQSQTSSLQQNDRAMIRQICSVRQQDIVTTRSNELLVGLGIEDLDCILKERRLWWYGLQWCSQDSLWHTGWWKALAWEAQDNMETADREGLQSGSSWPSTFMIDIPGDLVWDLPCAQQASYLEGGPLVWMLPLYLHVNQKSDCDDDTAFLFRIQKKKSVIFSWKMCLIWSYVIALFRVLKDFSINLTFP